jgi:hypothetical protein
MAFHGPGVPGIRSPSSRARRLEPSGFTAPGSAIVEAAHPAARNRAKLRTRPRDRIGVAVIHDFNVFRPESSFLMDPTLIGPEEFLPKADMLRYLLKCANSRHRQYRKAI